MHHRRLGAPGPSSGRPGRGWRQRLWAVLTGMGLALGGLASAGAQGLPAVADARLTPAPVQPVAVSASPSENANASASAEAGALFQLPTREGVQTPVFWQAHAAARATVLLFPGGGGGFGTVTQGLPTGANFLVRSVPHFLAQGLNVAIIGRPSDSTDLGYADRLSPNHLQDVAAVLAWVHARSAAPLWLVGTSRGTVSVLAAALQWQDQGRVAGVVLSSSILNPSKPGALPRQDLAALRLPVLLLHHRDDACAVCPPDAVPAALAALRQAPLKKVVWMAGGGPPRGDACGPWHRHGYIGLEREAVAQIAEWVTQPAP